MMIYYKKLSRMYEAFILGIFPLSFSDYDRLQMIETPVDKTNDNGGHNSIQVIGQADLSLSSCTSVGLPWARTGGLGPSHLSSQEVDS